MATLGSSLHIFPTMSFVIRLAPALYTAALAALALLALQTMLPQAGGSPGTPSGQNAAMITATSSFIYTFNVPGTLHESARFEESTSPYWWLNSGGTLHISGGAGNAQGALSPLDRWRLAYLRSSAQDTDQGYHPQNLLRLVTKAQGENVRTESHFKILADNFSASPNRNASNGLFLMLRYQDYQTLYYAGVRVDGTAVIKKKYKGVYYTMAQPRIFPGSYVQGEHINLLPHGEWIGLRADTFTSADGSVRITLFMKREREAAWKKIAEALDSGQYGRPAEGVAGTPPIAKAGHLGLRTDFMDVQFRNFRATAL